MVRLLFDDLVFNVALAYILDFLILAGFAMNRLLFAFKCNLACVLKVGLDLLRATYYGSFV